MRAFQLFFVVAAVLLSSSAFAVTETVPAGVRAMVYKYMYGNIPSSFGDTGVEKSLAVNATLGSSILKNLSSGTAAAYDQLAKIDPQLAANLDLGRVDLDPKITASINGFGLAWGLTDQIMVAGAVPFYKADVKINGGYSQTGSLNNAITALDGYSTNMTVTQQTRDSATILKQVLAQLPALRGEYLQGALVNDYGYKPVGDWSGAGIGDVELFSQYRFIEMDDYAQAIKFGHSFPTGRGDDPDNLVDVPFGSGYHSTYIETLHDFTFYKPMELIFGFNARLQHNWATHRVFRLAPSDDFPLSRNKENVALKPGETWIVGGDLGSKILGTNFSWDLNYTIKNKGSDKASGIDPNYDYGILVDTSASRSHTVGAGITYSTVEPFKHKKFPIPLMVGLEASRVIKGYNTEKLEVYAFNLKLFF